MTFRVIKSSINYFSTCTKSIVLASSDSSLPCGYTSVCVDEKKEQTNDRIEVKIVWV